MKYLLRFTNILRSRSNGDLDDGGGGEGVNDVDLTPTETPTIEETVAHRKMLLHKKEKEAEESRKNRFSKKSDEETRDEVDLHKEDTDDVVDVEDTSEVSDEDYQDEVDDDNNADADDDDIDFWDEEEDAGTSSDDIDDDPNDQQEEDDDDDDEPQNMRTLRKQIKSEGQARKRAETDLVTAQSEIDRLNQELESEKDKTSNLSSQNINWGSHESVKPLWDEFDSHIYRGASSIGQASAAKQFAEDAQDKSLLSEYYELTKGVSNISDKIDRDAEFRTTLEERYGINDAANVVTSVSDALNVYLKIEDKVQDLKDKHTNNTLEFGVNDYDKSIHDYQDHIDDLGNVDDDYLDTAPDSVESIVGSRYKSDPQYKTKADKFKKNATQFIFGLRPLSQKELDRAQANASTKGMTLDQYLNRRETNFKKARSKFINDVFYNHMVMEDFDEIYNNHKRVVAAKSKRKTVKKVIKGKPSKSNKAKEVAKEDTKEKVYPGHPDWVPVTKRFGK